MGGLGFSLFILDWEKVFILSFKLKQFLFFVAQLFIPQTFWYVAEFIKI